MKITALAENRTNTGMRTVHGLALYIETENHKMMFDLGPDETMFENAEKLGIDLKAVDTVVISHGHKDHGGALGRFLSENEQAKIYIQKRAFAPHISRPGNMVKDISLDVSLMDNPRIVLLEGAFRIDEELELFTAKSTEKCYSYINKCLYEGEERDSFKHEQNLLIHGDRLVLILGCGHSGIVNILDCVEDEKPAVCVGGFHLGNPDTGVSVDDTLLDAIAKELALYKDTRFYTCHCTGLPAYEYLRSKLDNMNYLACGDSIEIS